jgi:hypothetical protein
MPLAIIGNEYDKAWNMIKEEEFNKEEARRRSLEPEAITKQQLLPTGNKITPLSPVLSVASNGGAGFPLTKSGSVDKKSTTTFQPRHPSDPSVLAVAKNNSNNNLHINKKMSMTNEEKKLKVKASAVMIIRHSLIDKLHHLHVEYKNHPRHVAPSVTIGLCELRAWLPTFVLGIEEVLRSIHIYESRINYRPGTALTADLNSNNSGINTNNNNNTGNPQPQQQVAVAAPPAGRRRYSVVGARGAVVMRSMPVALPPPSQSNNNHQYNNNNNYQSLPQSQSVQPPASSPSFAPLTTTTRRPSLGKNGPTLPTVQEAAQSFLQRRGINHHDDDEDDDGSLGSFDLSTDSGEMDYDPLDENSVAIKKPSQLTKPIEQIQKKLIAAMERRTMEEEKSEVETNSDDEDEDFDPDEDFEEFSDLEKGKKNSLTPAAKHPALELKSALLISSPKKTFHNNNNNDGGNNDHSNTKNIPTTTTNSNTVTFAEVISSPEPVEKAEPLSPVVPVSPGEDEALLAPARFSQVNTLGNHRRGLTMTEAEYVRSRNRTSVYNKLLKMLRAKDPELRRRTFSEETVDRLRKVAKDPRSYKNRLWILLEFPHSSKEARALQILLIFLICMSIFIMYTQTVTSLTRYGEKASICGALLTYYCQDKDDISMDPGCFVQTVSGPTRKALRFNCDESDCFGHGLNFGSGYTNMTCTNGTSLPFQSAQQLEYNYGLPFFFTSRQEMQRISPVCSRIECTDNSVGYYDAGPIWIGVEFLMNTIFLIELMIRILVAQSVSTYCKDVFNIFDILAIVPFFLSVALLNDGGFNNIDFSILASSPYNFYIVLSRSFMVFRLFKLTRHFRASKVLFETATVVWRQISGMLALLALCVLLFSIVLYELEKGRACYLGDPDCQVPLDYEQVLRPGDLVYIGKKGLPSQFTNIFYSVWFSYATATTTGYGDMVPITNGGQVMSIFLMVAGTFYMAMPLTAAATTFYNVHERYLEKGDNYMNVGNPNAVAPTPGTNNNKNGPNNASNNENNPYPDKKNSLKPPGVELTTQASSLFHHNSNSNNSPRPSVGNILEAESANSMTSDDADDQTPHQRRHIMSDIMKGLVHNAIHDFRSFDRLIEGLITDLHSSPNILFDELLMKAEEKKFKEQFPMVRMDSSKTILSTTSSRSRFESFDEEEVPFKRFMKIRRNIAKFCKGLEDTIRQNEQIIIDLLYLHYSVLHGEVE